MLQGNEHQSVDHFIDTTGTTDNERTAFLQNTLQVWKCAHIDYSCTVTLMIFFMTYAS